ncbi:MAG TPA: metallophosphoesterase [Clostridia bacterium]|nr:metallophosphoesterase [Clostridia bacterium]
MSFQCSRRQFIQRSVAGAATLALSPSAIQAAAGRSFSFVLLGDLHLDKLEHHDLGWLEREKPDDLRQVRDYSRITKEMVPKLLAAVRETVADLNRAPETRVAFIAQAGDLVEGLCGREDLAVQHNRDAIKLMDEAKLGAPFLFTKGNHDITGAGAPAAFASVFHPFLSAQRARLGASEAVTSANYEVEYGDALFCFFDAYDRESLPWLEGVLARRSARHCFLLAHPPVVPYGARSTWYLFAAEREKAQRERLLELLGKNRAFVLGGHIHKYSVLTRATPAGSFLQLALSSVISRPEVTARNVLSGPNAYTPDQVSVEPTFSPATEPERRAVYKLEGPFVKGFEYADLPGFAVIRLAGAKVTATVYSGVSRQVWRELDLSGMRG